MALAANAAAPAIARELRIDKAAQTGCQIFVYSNIRTNHVVYSLTRSLNNTRSLKQIPFAGKKTVPPALRRDLWTPLCVLSFPNQLQGLSAYQKLREFKHLHEVQYPLSAITHKEGKRAGTLMSKKERGKVIMNQKANSIADMAAVLAIQARPASPEKIQEAEKWVSWHGKGNKPKYGVGSKTTSEALEFQGNVDGVSIWWANPLDAEYAETWPEPVKHGPLAVSRYTAVWPPPEDLLLGKKASDQDAKVAGRGDLDKTPAESESKGFMGRLFSRK